MWSPESWRSDEFDAKQQPAYEDPDALKEVADKIKSLPPLVSHGEVLQLKQLLSEAPNRFIVMAGDCAETFGSVTENDLKQKVEMLLQLSFVLTFKAGIKTTRIGRLAGQWAKPRSNDWEVANRLKVFRGENVNAYDHEGDPENRLPDPQRLLSGHFHACATLNYLRTLLRGPNALGDLRNASKWTSDLPISTNDDAVAKYRLLVDDILKSVRFLDNVGAVSGDAAFKTADLFTAHEALLLPLEEALTRRVGGAPPRSNDKRRKLNNDDEHYNCGAHMLWIGNRTRGLNSAHVEYASGISNPLGLKVGFDLQSEDLNALVDKLNPSNRPGKLVLITRFGVSKGERAVRAKLKELVDGLGTLRKVVWMSDPMHGNTFTKNGLKTRNFDDVLSELTFVHSGLKACGVRLGGVHLELTNTNVTECVGGPQSLTEEDLPKRHLTLCDPRLNAAQSLDLAFRLAELLAD